MLYAFGFDRVGVLVSDMYIVIPSPRPGQEGAELSLIHISEPTRRS